MYLAFALGSALAPGNTCLALPTAELGLEFAHAQSPAAVLHLLYYPVHLKPGAVWLCEFILPCTGKEH